MLYIWNIHSSLKYFDNSLKYFDNSLKYFDNSLKNFDNSLKYFDNSLQYFDNKYFWPIILKHFSDCLRKPQVHLVQVWLEDCCCNIGFVNSRFRKLKFVKVYLQLSFRFMPGDTEHVLCYCVYTVRKVLADSLHETDDAIAKLYVTLKFPSIEGNGRKLSHIELSNSVIS